ncbi:transmembrane protein 248 [Hypomesus transpacificus]|uniref:transmembrane protein 248 n=1 Tax=Hypomesus transpacificus TaxID=137520 RepID=UPI001F07CE3E|nr:transmembrane protein 248 [Hypomesus transpacificus]XP_046904292.1 transmembrane protein 248 [Hypomesus transpacificus]
MGSWNPVSNLRNYASQHPPAVTFFLCLLILALSFISISSYAHTQTLPNPDTKDWNNFLSSIALHQLCEVTNGTTDEQVSSPPIGQKTGGNSLESPSQTPPPVTQYSLLVPLALVHKPDGQTPKVVELHTSLSASQLGLTGDETVIVALQVFPLPTGENTFTCLTVSAAAHTLPPAPLPPQCPTNEKMSPPVQVVTVETGSRSPTASRLCYSLKSTHDPTLTAVLTQEQQDIAVQHLVEVSVVLLGMCVLLCLSASFTHPHRHQGNGLGLQMEPLIDS